MKIFITGGAGFLGHRIAQMLVQEGHQVTSFSRTYYPFLEKEGIQSVIGDIQDLDTVKKSMAGHDAVIHTAAKIGMFGQYIDFHQTNVVGTQNLLNAAMDLGINYFIYTSSPSVVFGQEDLCGADETIQYPKEHLSFYAKTKAEAERIVLKAGKTGQIKTVSLRPHLILGPGDKNLFPKLMDAHIKGQLKRVGNGENLVDVIHVDNAAKAHLLALEKLIQGRDISGEAYFLGQESPVNLWKFINELFTIIGIGEVTKHIPFTVAYYLGGAMEKYYTFQNKFNQDPPMTRFVATQLAKGHYFSHKKAQKDLDYFPHISLTQMKKDITAPYLH